MDFGHPSKVFMPDLTPSLESTMFLRVAEFIDESGSLEQYAFVILLFILFSKFFLQETHLI